MPEAQIIIPGFHPDPSICRRGGDYYIANSSFGYFPGVPIHHSRDLVTWRLIGYALRRPAQLPLAGATATWGGIYAPTLRYHANTFWLITTNVTHGGHFITTADDPAGPWSDPVWIDSAHQGGIDPDLFWDDDGSCWVSCTRNDRNPAEPQHGIWQFRVDPASGCGTGARHFAWGGTGGKSPEGPHLFKRHGVYYLLAAEGGTEYGHMVTLARGPSVQGPWEACPHNPILTHRSIGASIQSLGHADWLEDADGNWWIVFLGVRPVGYPLAHHLGRETCMAPMTWGADGWPVVNHGQPIRLAKAPASPPPLRLTFETGGDLWHDWCCLRDPAGVRYSLAARPGWLRLHGRTLGLDAGRPAPEKMAMPPWECTEPMAELHGPVSWLGVRQRHFDVRCAVVLDYHPDKPGEEAGLAVFMSERCHYALAIRHHDGQRVAALVKRVLDMESSMVSAPLAAGPVALEISATHYVYSFACTDARGCRHDLGTGLTRLLSTEVAGGFAGVFFALYACDPSDGAGAPADFADFVYEVM